MALLAVLVAPARALPAELLGYTIALSLAASSDGSTRAGHAEDVAEAPQQQLEPREDGAPCAQDGECRGRCAGGLCTSAPVRPQCATDDECTGELTCRDGFCVLRPPPPCADDLACPTGKVCTSGRCVAPPAPPACSTNAQCPADLVCTDGACTPVPPPAILRRGTERLLQERATQLKEDLALGQGPVLAVLAASRGVTPKALGRALRAHRAELDALVGDDRDPAWPARFLERIDALAPPRG